MYFAIVLFSFAGVLLKMASSYNMLSYNFLILCTGALVINVIYAFIWQRVLKIIDISIIYSVRSLVVILSLMWAVVIFKENITINNIIGAIFIILGIIMVKKDG